MPIRGEFSTFGKSPRWLSPPPGVTAVASVALFQQRQHTAEPLMFCVWCSLALVLARPFGSGDSGTPGLSMHRVSAASENLDGSAIQTARSFEWPGRLNDGTDFSTTRSGRSSASVAFSYLTMNVANLLKRRPRAAHDQVHQAPHWYQVKHTGVHGGTSPPSSSAADLPPEEWVVPGGATPRLPPDDDERSWGDLQCSSGAPSVRDR